MMSKARNIYLNRSTQTVQNFCTVLRQGLSCSILALLFFAYNSFSLELETKQFIICKQKRATGIYLRSISIYELPAKTDSNNKKYVTVYRKKNQDNLIAIGNRLAFAKKISAQTQKNLEKNLWKCNQEANIKAFYSNKKVFTKTNSIMDTEF